MKGSFLNGSKYCELFFLTICTNLDRDYVAVPGASEGEGKDPKEQEGGEPNPGFWAIAGQGSNRDPLQEAIR